LGDDPDSSRLVGGIKNAAIVLIVTPFLLLGGAILYLRYTPYVSYGARLRSPSISRKPASEAARKAR
jgi:hypothetical protein